jgi:hypothetical protein
MGQFLKYGFFISWLIICSVHPSGTMIHQLIKLYEQPYKHFRAIELLVAELDTDLSLVSRNSSIKITIRHHIEQQMHKLSQLLTQLQQDKDELDTYLIEDFRYLQNLICGLTLKYHKIARDDELIFNALQQSNTTIREMILNNNEVAG